MAFPSERQWVTIGLFVLTIGMGLMAMAQPKLWEVDTFKTVLQGVVISGLLNMVGAFHFAANKTDESKAEIDKSRADNTGKAFDALKAQAENNPSGAHITDEIPNEGGGGV